MCCEGQSVKYEYETRIWSGEAESVYSRGTNSESFIPVA